MEFPDVVKYSIPFNRRFLEQWFILALTKATVPYMTRFIKQSLTLRPKTKTRGYTGRRETFLKTGNFYN